MKKPNIIVTDFLFPDTDFITGIGSAFNLAGDYYEMMVSKTADEADNKAIVNDWKMVGQDISNAADKFAEENNMEPVSCS